MASLAILQVHSGVGVAPAGIWFEAVDIAGFAASGGPGPGAVYDPSFHEITYVWDFGDVAGAAPLAPLNMPTVWKNRNIAYGKKAAHLFRDPGTYSVTLWAVDREGNTASATATVTVADPDVVYAGSRTAVYDPSGGFEGAPAGAQLYTTQAQFTSYWTTATQPVRILFQRGSVSEFQIGTPDNASGQNCQFGAVGTGPRPVLYGQRSGWCVRVANDWGGLEITFSDFDFRGHWDASREAGDPRTGLIYLFDRNPSGSPFFIFDNCSMDGFGLVTLCSYKPEVATSVMFNDCQRTNWPDYGFFGHGNDNPNVRIALLATASVQHIDACNGGGAPETNKGKTGFSNDHGPLRIARAANVILSCCDFFSRNGWSGATGGLTADQSCLRINSNAKEDFHHFSADRVVTEGGYSQIDAAANATSGQYAGNFLFDRMLMVGTAKQDGDFATWNHGGTTFRNIIAIMPLVKEWSNGVSRVFGLSSDNPGPGLFEAPQAIYSCTLLNLQSAANNDDGDIVLQEGIEAWTLYTVENNVVHAPVQKTPVTVDAPIDTATPIEGFTPRYKGLRFSGRKPLITLGSDVPDSGSLSVAYPDVATDTGSVQLGQSDFTPGSGHGIKVGQSGWYFENDGDFDVSFGASQITIVNRSGDTWATGENVRINMVRDTFITDATYASPASLPLPRPQSGSAAIGDGGTGFVTEHDAFGVTRAGSPARGALEP